MEKRTLIIGDVHGCHKELKKLLKKVGADPKQDRVIFIGDLINKGPSSCGVWELYREMEGLSLMGNHELSLLELVQGKFHKHSKYLDALHQDFCSHFDEFVADVWNWPLWLEDHDLMMVHAGLVPGLHPDQTDPWHLVTIRTWDGEGEDLKNEKNPPWFDLYDGEDLVVFGHWAALGGLDRPKLVGLDTGCVYGGKLSCLILPERKIVSVKANKAYASIN
jgi:bis(5'-nucleosyl)-tetraphosphatase (symmetrical)